MTSSSSSSSSCVAVLISSNSTSSSSSDGIPVVVWANQERTRQSVNDPWKQTLQYYEFLDDSRWTHLDALLTRLAPVSSLHVGSSENLKGDDKSSKTSNSNSNNNAKNIKMHRLLESLQVFIESRSDLSMETENDSEEEPNNESVQCHLHLQVPVDAAKLESTMQHLLVDQADAKLAYRGNTQLASSPKLQQGLMLWLRAQGLLSNTVDDSWTGCLQLETGVLTSHLSLDRTAAQCIHLLPPPNAGMATVVGGTMQNNSLLGILSNPCHTKMGKHRVQLWLRQPLVDLQKIQQRQDAVTALLGLGKDQIRESLKSFAGMDMGKLAQTLGSYAKDSDDDVESSNAKTNTNIVGESTKKPLQALYQLYLLASSKLPQLLEATAISDQPLPTLLQDARDGLTKLVLELERCIQLVEAVLDLDRAPREFLIKPDYKEELIDLHQELQSTQTQVDDELERMQELLPAGTGTVRLEQDTDGSWQFRLPNTNDSKVLDGLGGGKIQMHRILKNGVYFSTKPLRELSSQHQELNQDYARHSKQVVQDAMAVATTYQTVVERASDIVANLDVLCSLAHVAAYSPHGFCKPTLTDSEDDGMGIQLQGARHPCVELQEDVDYIPNDISLVFGESNFLLVTGPNMGGKSTYIRALGAIVTLAQIGSYVPCQSATINICHAILARVGAGDLQERGISTFMAEMLEASSILKTATKRSLIIIDELGRGTSTFDGYGLARAISEYVLQKIGCMVVFATHFHELTALEREHSGVQNCHVGAQKGQQGLTFLYQVRPGPCLESFGIQVAEMANVPACVIEDAKRKALQLENFQYKRARTNDSGDNDNDNDVEFVETFLNLDIPSILKQNFATEEEKKASLLQLLAN